MLILAVFYPVINIKIKTKVFQLETYFNPIGILILFFSMVYISKYLDTTGFFEFCALYALKKSGTSATKLFFIIYVVVSILTIFTSNDVVVLTFTPFIHYFAKAAGIDPVPFLFGEFFAANTWSMIFIISNPTNVVIGTAFGQSFTDFAKYMALTALVGGVVNCALLFFIFKVKITQEFEMDEDPGDPKNMIKSKLDMCIALFFTLGAILLMALSSIPGFNVEMWIIAGIMAVILLIYNIVVDCIRHTGAFVRIFSSLPYPIIFFLLSLFILVNSLDRGGLFKDIGKGFHNLVGSSETLNTLLFGVLSTVSANVLNNIPMSVAYVPIIKATHSNEKLSMGAIYASVVGANLGANLTPLGALAGLMWLKILKERQIDIGFGKFMKIGLAVTPICLAFTLSILIIMVEFT